MSSPEQAPAERGERRSWFTRRTSEERLALREEREDRRYAHNERAIAMHRSMNYGNGMDDANRDPSGGLIGLGIGGLIALVPCELAAYAILTSAGVAAVGVVFALMLAAAPVAAMYFGFRMGYRYEPR